EPEFVFSDRTPQGSRPIVEIVDLVHGRQAPGAQVVGQVAALQVLVRVQTEGAALKSIPALLGNEVHDDAAGDALGGDATSFDRHFFGEDQVVDDAGRGTANFGAVGPHAVNGHFRAGLAMVHAAIPPSRRLVHASRTTDV